jgi:hypothetical protein
MGSVGGILLLLDVVFHAGLVELPGLIERVLAHVLVV